MTSQGLLHKVVLITGATRGIGRAAALEYARAGADVVLTGRDPDRLQAVRREVEALGVRVLALGCDVTVQDEVTAAVKRAAAELGGIDVLVNNAGLGLYGPIEATGDEQLRRVFEVNVFGLARMTRAALPELKARKGVVVNVSSVLGYRGLPLLGGYAASKAAVNALSESLRVELAPEGVAVLLVSPGLTQTEFRENRLNAPGYEQEAIPLKAMSAEEVARAMVAATLSRRAETVLTLAGRVMVTGNRLFPRLFDRVAGRMVGKPVGSGEGR